MAHGLPPNHLCLVQLSIKKQSFSSFDAFGVCQSYKSFTPFQAVFHAQYKSNKEKMRHLTRNGLRLLLLLQWLVLSLAWAEAASSAVKSTVSFSPIGGVFTNPV